MDSNENCEASQSKVGFIVTRHVNNSVTNRYWIECYLSIRKYYKDNLIVFIDDHSDYKYVDSGDTKLENVRVIRSEYPKRGELLPYVYYVREKFFDTAVIIHDSFFINSFIDFSVVETFRIFWDFKKCFDPAIIHYIYEFFEIYKNSDSLKCFYKGRDRIGIFGAMMVIKHDALLQVNAQYNFDLLIDKMYTRDRRCAFERVLATLVYSTFPDHKQDKIYFGDIHEYCVWGIEYSQLESYRHLPVIKIWTSR